MEAGFEHLEAANSVEEATALGLAGLSLPMQKDLRKLKCFTQTVKEQGGTPTTQLLGRQAVRARDARGGRVVDGLRVAPDESVGMVRRLRLINGIPICLQEVYLSLKRFRNLLEVDELQLNNLYEYMGTFGVVPAIADEYLSVERADYGDAKHLGLRGGSPIVVRNRVTYTAAGEPVEALLSFEVPMAWTYHYTVVAENFSAHDVVPKAKPHDGREEEA